MTLSIRLATPADAPGCLAIYRPYVEHTAVSFETDMPGEQAFGRRIAETLATFPWLVCCEGGAVAGYAYATRYRPRAAYQWSVETTIYLGQRWRGRGVGRALYENLLACLRRQGFVNAYAVITLPNPASVTLHERLGFRPLAVFAAVGHKLGRWHDVGWWHLRLQAPPLPATPPLPVHEALAGLRWSLPPER